MADGDIKLSVQLDTASAKKSANDLGSVMQKALSSSSPKIQSLGLQLQKVADRSKKVAAEMQALEKMQIPTDQFKALNKEIQTTESQLSKVEAQMQKMKNSGQAYVPTEEYSRLLSDESWLSKRINSLSEKKSLTGDQKAELAGLRQELFEVREEMQAVKDLGEAYKKSDAFVQKEKEAAALKSTLTQLNNQSTQMQTNGTAYTSGADTQRYSDLAQTQGYLSTQASMLIQKIETAMSKSSALKNLFISMTSTAAQGFRSVASAIGGVISKLAKATTSVIKHRNTSNLSFKKILTTIVKYAFGIRSIFMLYRKLRQVIKEGFTQLGNDFPEVQSQITDLKNSFNAFKSSIVSAFQPVISYVIPVLVKLIDYITSAANAVANFFALLTGQSYYYKAVKNNGAAADSISDTGDAAEDSSEKLADYDNLLVIDQDSSGSGGGSGSSGSSSAYNWEKVDVTSSKLFDELKKAWSEGDWEGLGSLISTKLTNMMNNIPWDTIFAKASDFGKNLASFLNGLITEDLFDALGTTIGNAIKTALTFLDSFGETFNWTNFGKSIATGINSFVKTNPLDLAVDTFNTWANGILDTLNTAVENVSWKEIGQHIADGIGKVDAFNIAWKLGRLVTNFLNAFYDLVSNKATWSNLGQKVADGINGFFEGFEASKLAKCANAIKDALFTALTTAIKNIKWSEIGKDIVSFLSDLDIGTIGLVVGAVAIKSGAAATLLSMATSAIMKALAPLGITGATLASFALKIGAVTIAAAAAFKIGWEFGTTAGECIAQWMKNAGIITDSANDEYYEIAESMTLSEKINDIVLSVKEGTFAKAWTNMWGDWFDPTFAEIENLGVKIKSISLSLIEGWNNTNDKIWDPVFELGEDIWEGIKEGFEKAVDWVDTIKEMFDSVVKQIKEKFDINSPAKKMEEYGQDIFLGIVAGFKAKFSALGDKIKELPGEIKNWFKEHFPNGYNALEGVGTIIDIGVNLIKNGWDTVSGWVGDAVQMGTSAVEKGVDLLKGSAGKAWTTVTDWINDKVQKGTGLVQQAVDLVKGVAEGAKGKWTSVSDWVGGAKTAVNAAVDLVKSGTLKKFKNVSAWLKKQAKPTKISSPVSLEKNFGKNKNSVADWLNSWKTAVTSTVSLAKNTDQWSDPASWVESYGNTASVTVGLNRGNWSTVAGWLAANWGATSIKENDNGTITVKTKIAKKGGIFDAMKGVWSNIAQYASGGLPGHGTLFAAGEAGAEVVGHIGGRTEVLNQSQLASVMHSAVVHGMLSVFKALSPFAVQLTPVDFDLSSLTSQLAQSPLPVIVKGQVLPTTEAFMVGFEETRQDISEIRDMVQQLIDIATTPDEGPKEPIVFKVDGKVMAQLVWDETAKKYKQTGNPRYRYS